MSSQPLDSTHIAAADTGASIVRFDGVSMRYGQSPDVLRNIYLDLAPGSFHFLTGASGAGKSSLLKLIYLAARPTAGRIQMFGRNLAQTPHRDLPYLRRRIGVVFQEFHLLDHLSAFDNAALPLRVSGGRIDKYRSDVTELLQWVGLGDRMNALPPTLSGGEKQRLAIARAVVNKPDILLADEPTGNVDHPMAMRILRLLVELNRMGTTVLIASHDEDLVARSGMPVLHLEEGQLHLNGAPTSPPPEPEPEQDDNSLPPEPDWTTEAESDDFIPPPPEAWDEGGLPQ
jgi:cell division transport system ATP-binding protein